MKCNKVTPIAAFAVVTMVSGLDCISTIKGILFDLDVVLYVGSKAIEGAVEAVEKNRASGMPCRFVTNTSKLSLLSLQQEISAMGFSIAASEIISAPHATLLYLNKQTDGLPPAVGGRCKTGL